MTCEDCVYLKFYRGHRDRYGIQTDPDDYECTGNATEADLDKYFADAEDGAEHCCGFSKRMTKEDFDED